MLGWLEYSSIMIILAAVCLDLLMGDPRWLPHPVRGFGLCIKYVERKWNKGNRRRLKGMVLLIVIAGGVWLISTLALLVAYHIHWLLALVGNIYLLSTTLAIKGLDQAARKVWQPLCAHDLAQARHNLSQIVGRDTAELNASEIVRGTVETVAENTVDGITAPLFWAMIGGAPLALTYRAVNTLDSMVGYRNQRYEQFGWASARCDDWLNWIPARCTAVFMYFAAWIKHDVSASRGWRVLRRDAARHASPNSGWSEAMMAGILGVQLGGKNVYQGKVSHGETLGESIYELAPIHIRHSLWLMHASWLIALMMIVTWMLWL